MRASAPFGRRSGPPLDRGSGEGRASVAPLPAERQRMGMPEIVRAMTRRWISEVPSKIV
jgi:hypothetical protein